MTIEEILAGESKNVEFKENLLEKSIKYMKSVVAFVNGTGGKIIFGIANKTREIVGFDKEDVFKKLDAIANAVSDSCEPAIIPDSTLQTVDGKTVIVVEIFEGRQQLRSWGILFERDGKDYPSNAFAILVGNGGLHVATQVSCKCAWLVEPQILYKKISTHLLIMEIDFCPVLCIPEVPVLQAFRGISHFVWYCKAVSDLS